MSRLQLTSVSRTFRGGAGVHDLQLSIEPGEIVALVGLNGAGKTTLMRLALGMLVPDSGAVLIDNAPLALVGPAGWSRVGHLIETPLAYPELTARDNLRLAARVHRAGPVSRGGTGGVDARVDAAIDQWKLGSYAGRRIRRLSLGNRQRVGLAAALQHDPMLVVLDEPSSTLDPSGVLILREALMRAASRGAGVLVSSHHLDEVARVAHRVVVMNSGCLIGELDPATPELERVFFERVRADDAQRSLAGVITA